VGETLTLNPAAAHIGVRADTLRDIAKRDGIPYSWGEMPSGQKWRLFQVSDLEDYKARRRSSLEGQLAALGGAA
jgi:hypothetical protein